MIAGSNACTARATGGRTMPIDLSTLAILAGLFFSAVVGDAVLFGDPLQVEITVPTKLVDEGFTQAAAEQLFVAEVARIAKTGSIIHTPDVHASSRPSVLAALAKPLGLDNVVVSLQSQLGREMVTVQGAVLTGATPGTLDMVVFVTEPLEPVVKIKLTQADGNPTALVERGSEMVLEKVAPYRVALTDFADGLDGDSAALARAKEVATRALARPFVAHRATERVMMRNLLGLVALLDGDMAEAEKEFNMTKAIPSELPAAAAQGTIALNRAFVAVAQRRPKDAVDYFKAGQALSAGLDEQGYQGRVATIGGLVAWSAGDTGKAKAWFRKSIAEFPIDEAPHFYLAQLLTQMGDPAGAAAERAAAAEIQRIEIDIPALALSDFWVDPVQGGLKVRP
jgi:hypothetical protein